MPDGRIFLDTNILIYAYDVSAGEKHAVAEEIVMNLWQSGFGVVSTQVLQEFFCQCCLQNSNAYIHRTGQRNY